MKSKFLNLVCIFLPLAMFSCTCKEKVQPEKKETSKMVVSDSTLTESDLIDNEYTQVMLSFCTEKGEEPMTYENTRFIDLSDSGCFVSQSALDCGYIGGNCGDAITIYQKNKGKYSIAFQKCGYNIHLSTEKNFGIHSFTYESKDGYRRQVRWDGKKFQEEKIAYPSLNLNFDALQIIEKVTGLGMEDYSIFDPENPYCNILCIKEEPFKMGKGSHCFLYSVEMSGGNQHFLIENGRLLLHCTGIKQIGKISGDNKKYPDLKTFPSDDCEMGTGSSCFTSTYYTYSAKKQKYMKCN